RVDRGDWANLGLCPYLSRLTALDISSNSFAGELVDTLIHSWAFPVLESLRLRWFALGDELTIRLVGHSFVRRLRTLDLWHNGITAEGAIAIVASAHLGAIESLNLRGNPLTADRLTVEALRKRFGERVKL